MLPAAKTISIVQSPMAPALKPTSIVRSLMLPAQGTTSIVRSPMAPAQKTISIIRSGFQTRSAFSAMTADQSGSAQMRSVHSAASDDAQIKTSSSAASFAQPLTRWAGGRRRAPADGASGARRPGGKSRGDRPACRCPKVRLRGVRQLV